MEMRAKIWWKKRKGAASSESSQSEAVQSAPPSEEPPKSPRPGREASSKGLQPREKVLAARQAFLEGLQSRSNSPLPEREAFVKEFQSRSNSPLPEREAFVKEFQSRSKAPQSGREAFLKDWQSRSKSKVGRNAQLAHRKLLAARDTANPFDQLVEDEIKRIAADRAAMAKESEENKRKKMVAEGIGLVNPSNPRLEEARKALFGGSVAPTPWWEENRRIPRRKAMEPGETRLVTAERAAMAKESEGNKRKEMAAERTGPVNPSNPRLEEARKALFEGSVAPTPWWEENRRIPRRKAIEPEETGLVNPSIPPPPAKVKVETLESKTQLEPGISTDSAEDSANAVAQISESGSKDAAAGSETTSPAKPPFRRKRYRKAVDIPAESGSLSADHHSLQREFWSSHRQLTLANFYPSD
ncbi:hypothetical protein N7535_006197 [Penicillium sp. DV-2018c]|nr:hypothetical protein N7535_006197 [Penicillium sp. DV-2018c]